MLAAAGVRLSRHTRGGPARTHFSSSIGTFTHQKPYRKGVVCQTVASLILICGLVMTILGSTRALGGDVTIVGLLLIAIAVLLSLFSIRQFLIAKKMRQSEQNLQITHGTVTAMVIEREDELGTVTVVMDTVNIEPRCRRRESNQDYAPPDYTEATSDFFPETSTGDADTSTEPPPPYGPPPYDEVVSDKIKSGERIDDEPSADVITDVSAFENTQNDTVSQNSHMNHESGTESRSQENTPRSEIIGYQDLPTVTI